MDPGPAVPSAAASETDKPWGDGITVSVPSQPLKGKDKRQALMADSYGFAPRRNFCRCRSTAENMVDGS